MDVPQFIYPFRINDRMSSWLLPILAVRNKAAISNPVQVFVLTLSF